MHTLIGLSDPNGVYLPQPHKFFQSTKNRLYSTLAFAFHIATAGTVHAFDVPLVLLAVGRDADFLFKAFANALLFYGAALAVAALGEIEVFQSAFFQALFAEGNFLPLWT